MQIGQLLCKLFADTQAQDMQLLQVRTMLPALDSILHNRNNCGMFV